VNALDALAPASAPRAQEVDMNATVLLFTMTVTLLTSAVAGLAPAAAARSQLTAGLRDGGRESTAGSRVQGALVGAEIAMALVLVVGAALLIRTLVALQRVDLGFASEHVLTASIVPPRTQYRDPEAMRQLYRRLLDRAGAIPGVTSAGLTNMLPLAGGEMNLSFRIEGRPPAPSPGGEPVAAARIVSASYVPAMGMRLVSGRQLSALDTEDAPGAVLVNEAMVRRYWPAGSAIGAKIQIGDLEAAVVGVVGDVHHRGPGAAPGAEMYIPFTQFPSRQATIVLRTTADPAALAGALRAVMKDVDPSLPLANVTTLDALVAQSVSQPAFLASLLGGFAAVAAALALVGVYGLLSFYVSRRFRELGVRMALGAGRARVIGLVLRRSGMLVAAGLVAGTGLAIVLSRLLGTLLFGVRAGDPATVAAMALAIAAASLAASLPPALRASRIDPVIALREE